MPNGINSRHILSILEAVLKRHAEEKVTVPDFCKWLSGKSGWMFDAELEQSKNRKPIVDMLNELQVIWKKFATKELKYVYETKQIWTKTTDLKAAVFTLRDVLENIQGLEVERPPETNLLHFLVDIGEGKDSKKSRLTTMHQIVEWLMRNSNRGPDAPVKWAGHNKRNVYALTVVTKATMKEAILGMCDILYSLFLGYKDFDKDDLNNAVKKAELI